MALIRGLLAFALLAHDQWQASILHVAHFLFPAARSGRAPMLDQAALEEIDLWRFRFDMQMHELVKYEAANDARFDMPPAA